MRSSWFFHFIVSLIAVLGVSVTLAGTNVGITYVGRILRPDGTPANSGSITFTLNVMDASNNCKLWSETQTVNMADSFGTFALVIGEGTRTDGGAQTLRQVFMNAGTLTSLTCITGTTYTPGASDDRNLVVAFSDAGTTVSLGAVSIKSAPYAMQADQVGGYGILNIAKISGIGTATTITGTQFDFLANLAAPASSTSSPCTANDTLKFVGGVWTCAAGGSGSAAASGITAAIATNSINNANFTQTWDWSTLATQTGLSLTSSNNSFNSTGGILNVANTGTSTTGTVARIQSNSTAGSGITVLANGNVGVGTTTPTSPLTVKASATGTMVEFKNSANTTIANIATNAGNAGYLSVNDSAGTAKAAFGSDWNSGAFIYADASTKNVPDGGASQLGAGLAIKTPYVVGQENGIFFFNGPGIGDAAGAAVTFYTSDASNYGRGGLKFKTTNSGSVTTRMTIDPTGNVGIGTTGPQVSLDVGSKTDGIRLPNGTTVQQPTCAAATEGTFRYNSTNKTVEVCNGTAWFTLVSTVPPGCTSPNAFSFTNQTGVSLGTTIYSNTITPTGCASAMGVTVTGGGSPEVSINGGPWVTSGSINPGETIRVRLASSAAVSTLRSAVVAIGGASSTWDVTTRAGSLKIFVTTATYLIGGLGSLAAADANCQSQAVTLGYAGTYMALLSDETTNAKDRVTITYPVVRASDGTTVVAATNLFSGTLDNAISSDVSAWTGTKPDGTKDTGYTCSSWSSAAGTTYPGLAGRVFGGNGSQNASNWSWIHNSDNAFSAYSCNTQLALYCIQQ